MSSGTEAFPPTALLGQVQSAIREGRDLTLNYFTGGTRETQVRRVTPSRIYYRFGRAYVEGFCHLRGEKRVFRADRILSLDVAEDSARVDESAVEPPGYPAPRIADRAVAPHVDRDTHVRMGRMSFQLLLILVWWLGAMSAFVEIWFLM